jgi:prepilin-type N-terminal cleavage/methylation domain-containing protein/prepilin-type processing-associated H-X9-DG protein
MMQKKRIGFSLIELLIVIAIIGLLIGLILVAVQNVRASAAKTRCVNQLRQLGLALHQYHDANKKLPSGISFQAGKSPQLYMTWMVRILPYLEQDTLYREAIAAYEKEKDFDKGPHLSILGRSMPAFSCPTDPLSQKSQTSKNLRVGITSYLGVSGTDTTNEDGVLYSDSGVTMASITDGTSNTISIGERHMNSEDLRFGWWYAGIGQNATLRPGSADSILGVRELQRSSDPPFSLCPLGPYHFRPGDSQNVCNSFRFWSHHSGGANFCFADGSARFLRYEADSILPALATRSEGETVEIP